MTTGKSGIAFLCAGAILLWAVPVRADRSQAFAGNTTGGPTFNRPIEGDTGGVTPYLVRYQAQGFRLLSNSTCVISSAQDYDGFLHLYGPSFNPAAPLANRIDGDDDGELGAGTSRIPHDLSTNGIALAAGTYVLVNSGFSANSQGAFQNFVACDGDVQPLHGFSANSFFGIPREQQVWLHDRFIVAIDQVSNHPGNGIATPVRFGSKDSAFFWFYNDTNFEVQIKVLNACAINGHWWVFIASTSNQAHRVSGRLDHHSGRGLHSRIGAARPGDNRPEHHLPLPMIGAARGGPSAVGGIHHVSAIASDPRRNLDFYTQVLGLRRVKLTVNFDDPATYHFYFGNQAGSPGSILTFFVWPGAGRGTVGSGQVSAVAFGVAPGSLDWWLSRLADERVLAEEAPPRLGERVIRLADPDGMRVELIATPAAATDLAWREGPVPHEHAIGGFHSATLTVEGYERTAATLRDRLGLEAAGNEGNRFRFEAPAPADGGNGSPGSLVDVLCAPDGRFGALGAGTIHHIAWRARDHQDQLAWRRDLVDAGFDVSPVMDRVYFHSVYFREPGGILFEIATDGPGFATDEAPDRLGQRLMLPPWLEAGRAAVERALPPLLERGGT